MNTRLGEGRRFEGMVSVASKIVSLVVGVTLLVAKSLHNIQTYRFISRGLVSKGKLNRSHLSPALLLQVPKRSMAPLLSTVGYFL